jgi:hypothetical protein
MSPKEMTTIRIHSELLAVMRQVKENEVFQWLSRSISLFEIG